MKEQIKISERQKTLSEKVQALKDKKGLSGADLARITGRSEGTISDLLGAKKSFSDKLLGLIHDSLRDYIGENELIETRQHQRIWNIAKSAKSASDFRLVVGNTGIGKSVVFRKFAEENQCCCYCKIYNRNITWNNFLSDVCKGFGVRMKTGKKRYYTSELLNAFIGYVEENSDKNPMLVIDESEVMRNIFFKEFKNLRTATEGLLSIVLVGITEVESRIAKLAGLDPKTWIPNREDSNQYTTFARRIKHFRIPNISTDDMISFCKANGIESNKTAEQLSLRWWNYDEADRFIRKAKSMGINLAAITPKEIEIL